MVRGVRTNAVGRGFTPAAFVRTKSRMRGVVVSRPSKASVGVLGKAEDNAPYRVNAYMVRVVRRNM